jgi:hypothetical protein
MRISSSTVTKGLNLFAVLLTSRRDLLLFMALKDFEQFLRKQLPAFATGSELKNGKSARSKEPACLIVKALERSADICTS